MPFAPVFDLQLYYQDLVPPRAARHTPPLLLIHGSGETGDSGWSPLRDALTQNFRVILPDCRGHGRTLDPRNEYTFKTLAADLAELLRVLELAPAFVAGHSNGGNVALVLCAEHPAVVRRAVLMAANAYVSADLLKYGDGHWGDRVAASGSEWAQELAALHDANRYPGYWRELLNRTGLAIARAPNYTPADLARITMPILVVQGENDTVNAPSHHAEFLAEHLGHAQLWLAPNTGHNVHKEHPAEWGARVTRFLMQA